LYQKMVALRCKPCLIHFSTKRNPHKLVFDCIRNARRSSPRVAIFSKPITLNTQLNQLPPLRLLGLKSSQPPAARSRNPITLVGPREHIRVPSFHPSRLYFRICNSSQPKMGDASRTKSSGLLPFLHSLCGNQASRYGCHPLLVFGLKCRLILQGFVIPFRPDFRLKSMPISSDFLRHFRFKDIGPGGLITSSKKNTVRGN